MHQTSARASVGKKLIRAPDDLVQRLGEIANRQGKTLFMYVSQIFEQAIRVDEMKQSLEDVVNNFELMEIHREAGAVFIPREVLDLIVNKINDMDKEKLRQIWYRTGQWYGLYLKVKSGKTLNLLPPLLKEGLLDISRVDMKVNGEDVNFGFVSTSMSKERAEFIVQFVRGVMAALGYDLAEEDVFRGIVNLRFTLSKQRQ
ncbi:MAG: hypothetical protein QXI32_01035 [Candidatus Bathyarchaeia archaeon]